VLTQCGLETLLYEVKPVKYKVQQVGSCYCRLYLRSQPRDIEPARAGEVRTLYTGIMREQTGQVMVGLSTLSVTETMGRLSCVMLKV
jgi:hypothetical protein